jgi:hypothetical protein
MLVVKTRSSYRYLQSIYLNRAIERLGLSTLAARFSTIVKQGYAARNPELYSKRTKDSVNGTGLGESI